ncbi:MAG TPA: SCO family protein [Albitalea sp.]|nr:SCO family protein [Albitalea sp.]
MRFVATLAASASLVLAGVAHAQSLVQPERIGEQIDAPSARIVEQLDAPLPLALRLRDAQAREVALGSFFGTRPVLLVLGYYRCPQLCGLLMHGLLEALHDAKLGADDVRIVGVSIDPQDTPDSAAERQRLDLSYARFLAQSDASSRMPDLTLLVGTQTDIALLAERVGFVFERRETGDDPQDAQRFAHAAGIVVATPQGRISRTLMGVRFDADELRRAVSDAAQQRIGEPASAFALLCAHVDPRLGRHSAAVLDGIRAAAGLGAAAFAAIWWRRHRRANGAPR